MGTSNTTFPGVSFSGVAFGSASPADADAAGCVLFALVVRGCCAALAVVDAGASGVAGCDTPTIRSGMSEKWNVASRGGSFAEPVIGGSVGLAGMPFRPSVDVPAASTATAG